MASGAVFWITGLSGAGKTTIANSLHQHLRSIGRPSVFLDGDELRGVLGPRFSYGVDDRRYLAHTYARLSAMLSGQGLDVVCATVSMFHAVRSWNRENIPNYHEIYLRVPINELRRRDPKGLYRAAMEGRAEDVVGMNQDVELPDNPDMIIDNFEDIGPDNALARIWAVFVEGAASSAQHSRLAEKGEQ